jgi:hypothetical protein
MPRNKDRDGQERKNCEDKGAEDVDITGNLSKLRALPIAFCLLKEHFIHNFLFLLMSIIIDFAACMHMANYKRVHRLGQHIMYR